MEKWMKKVFILSIEFVRTLAGCMYTKFDGKEGRKFFPSLHKLCLAFLEGREKTISFFFAHFYPPPFRKTFPTVQEERSRSGGGSCCCCCTFLYATLSCIFPSNHVKKGGKLFSSYQIMIIIISSKIGIIILSWNNFWLTAAAAAAELRRSNNRFSWVELVTYNSEAFSKRKKIENYRPKQKSAV